MHKPVKVENSQDKLAYNLMRVVAAFVVIMLITLAFLLFKSSIPAVKEAGFIHFVTDSWWNPVEDEFGGLAFLYGTVVTSVLALLFASPISIAVAIFINELLPQSIGKVVGLFVEMIAAIPSIIFGLWGLFYLAPFVKDSLAPFLQKYLGDVPFIKELVAGQSFGVGVLTASIVLSIMIIPTITSICREVFKSVPAHQKEAALGLGATRIEMIVIAILKPSVSGILGGVVLGLGRALGETMAVAMLIGNQPAIKASLFESGATMASVIANEYAEAESDLHVSALCLIGIMLFLLSFVVNLGARIIVWKQEKKYKGGH